MPRPTTLGPVLSNDKLRVIYEKVDDLLEPVGNEAFELKTDGLKRGGTLSLFDETVDVTGSLGLTASIGILAADAAVPSLFGTGENMTVAAGESLASLDLELTGGAQAETSVPSPLLVSARGALNSVVSYRHLVPVRQSSRRLAALEKLIKSTRLPQLIDIGELEDGEAHRLSATLGLDFGLDLTAGRNFALEKAIHLFDGLPSAQLSVSGELTLRAALGLSLYEEMFLVVGRSGGFVRLRLQRRSDRKLGFSATLALQATYDFGGSLANVLEQALDQVRTPRLLTTLREIVDPLAGGDWDAIKNRLTGELADTLDELLDDTGWREWAAGSDKVLKLFALSKEVVDLYDRIDPTIQGLWDRILGAANLGPDSKLRQLLGELTQLDQPGFQLEDLLNPSSQANRLIELVETLSGKSLEEILLGSVPEIQQVFTHVAELARQAQRIFDLDDKAIAALHDFTQRTGIAATVDFLRQNATSLESFEGFVSQRIRRLVERLVGKAWERIDTKDLEKVQAWAQKIKDLLDAPAKFEKELLDRIRQLKGDVGFSLGFEIDRETRRTSLLDVEIDRSSRFGSFHRKIEKSLRRGGLRDLLEVLAREAEEAEKDGRGLPFLLRDSVFTSRRVRTSTASFFLTLFGDSSSRGISRRVEEATLRVSASGTGFLRTGSYSGGFSRTEVWNRATNVAAVWLDVEEKGTGLNLDAAFNGTPVARSLRLTYSRDDLETLPQELDAIGARLRGFGFEGVDLTGVPPRSQTRLSVDVRLPEKAITALLGELNREARWDRDFLLATQRWFRERLITRTAADAPGSDVSQGSVLEAFITHNPDFEDTWRSSVQAFSAVAHGKFYTLELPGRSVIINPPMVAGGPLPLPPFRLPYDPVREVISKRGRGLRAMRSFAGSFTSAAQGRTPELYEETMRDFTDAMLRTTVYSMQWPVPTFGWWLIQTRLSRLAPEVLEEANGVAWLRYKDSEQPDTWSEPLTWRLPKGLLPLS